jgi:6-phosphogluconolactonase
VIARILHTTDFAGDAARFILDHARKTIAERGLFRLGLTGGRSPKAINEALVAQAGDLSWSTIQLTFGDERCVPPDHEDSNYRVAKESATCTTCFSSALARTATAPRCFRVHPPSAKPSAM